MRNKIIITFAVIKNKKMKKIYSNRVLKQHWTKKGTAMFPKMQFETYEEAKSYLLNHKFNSVYKAYQCGICNKYHIGHLKY